MFFKDIQILKRCAESEVSRTHLSAEAEESDRYWPMGAGPVRGICAGGWSGDDWFSDEAVLSERFFAACCCRLASSASSDRMLSLHMPTCTIIRWFIFGSAPTRAI